MICTAIAVTLFFGCGSGEKNKQSDTTGQTQQSTSTAEKTADTGGESNKRITFPYTGEKVKLRGLWCNYNNRKNDTLVYNEYLNRIGNIEIDWEQATWADYEQKINLYYSSNDVPDIAICGDPSGTGGKYGPSGIFIDYEEYKDYMPNFRNLIEKYPYLNSTLDDQGHRYVIPTSIDGILTQDWAMLSWFYNKTLLEQYNIPVPETMDDVLNAARQLKAKDPEIIPLIAGELGDLMGSIMPLFGINSYGIEYDFDSKEWFYTPLDQTETYRAAVQLCNTLWKEKLLDPELATDNMDRIIQKMSNGKWAFQFAYITFYNESFKSKGVDLKWQPEPMKPPAINGKSYLPYTQTFDGDSWWGIVSGSNTKYPELVCSLIDFTLSEEISDLLNWGIENVIYKKNADGSKSYLPDVKTPSNPNGTKELVDIGLTNYNHILFKLADINATKLLSYGEWELKAQEFVDESLDNGTIIPQYRPQTPRFTQEEQDIISSAMTPIDTFVEEEMLKFIMGEKSMDEFDEFINKISTYGDIKAVIDIYNSKPKFELSPR